MCEVRYMTMIDMAMINQGNPLISWSYVQQNFGVFMTQLGTQAELTGIAIVVGSAISLPLAVAVRHNRWARSAVLGVSGIFYTIPSLALFALVQPIVGYFSLTSAEIALVSYTLLVLVRNVLTGLDGVPTEVREAARASGYHPLGSLLKVELPLALPAIFAGLRVATVTVVGLVTVTTFIGMNVLGQSIVMGFQNDFNTPIVVALILSVLLAGAADLALLVTERLTVRWPPPRRRTR